MSGIQSLPGDVFTKSLSQVLGLTFTYRYSQIMAKMCPGPFVNTGPGLCVGTEVKYSVWETIWLNGVQSN